MDNRLDFAQLASELASLPEGKDYPLEKWHPKHCGSLPLLIDTNGQWWSVETQSIHPQKKTPYRRPKLVQMLSKLLWCDPPTYKPGDPAPQYSLKTPHESVDIQVEDVPFIIVDYGWQTLDSKVADSKESESAHPVMICTTQLGESVQIGEQHPILTHPKAPHLPYIQVRRNLWARLNRNTYYRLIDELLADHNNDTDLLSLESNGHRFIIAGGNNDTTDSP